jgi:PKD repeat protein
VQNTTVGGSISLDSGTVAESRAGGGIAIGGYGIVQNNIVTGSITLGSGSVLTNTVTGGISVSGGGTVQGNNVEGAPGWGISAGAGSIVADNRLVGNASGIQVLTGTVRHNLIANTPGVGLQLGGSATAEHNTFTGIGGSAVKITGGTAVTLTGNNFEFNPGAYDVEDLVPKTTLMTVNARNNWWGTTSSAAIQRRIWDFNDDYNLGTVLYSPVLTEPSALAPAYVRAITLTPESPVGIQTVAFDVLFSREMNPEVAPALSFADYSGFYGGTWPAPNRYRAFYDFSTLVPRDTYTLTVRGAVGADGIQIAPHSATTFTVDYAGYINDTTPPPAPTVIACAAATPDTLSARWSASDPESTIDRYQYAIGLTPGGAEVVNWTFTTLTETTRTGLTLIAGQTYYVSVKARNEGGLWSVAGSVGVVAGSGGCSTNEPAPVASFEANPRSGPAPLTVVFTDTSTGTITAWEWAFGDGVTSTLHNPTHTYTTPGAYTVTLTVTGPGGSDTEMKANYITVTYPPPQADFTASPRSGVAPLEVRFTSTVTGAVTTYAWDFGDGGTGSEPNPTHTYQSAGSFGVTLVVTGPGGTAQVVKPGYITVSPPPSAPPAAGHSPSRLPAAGPVQLPVAGKDPGQPNPTRRPAPAGWKGDQNRTKCGLYRSRPSG